LIDHHIVRLNPGDESKDRETMPDEAWEPVPNKCANEDVEEVPVPKDATPIGL
jgi:hypothetical protein